jgi:hypothetical protein
MVTTLISEGNPWLEPRTVLLVKCWREIRLRIRDLPETTRARLASEPSPYLDEVLICPLFCLNCKMSSEIAIEVIVWTSVYLGV